MSHDITRRDVEEALGEIDVLVDSIGDEIIKHVSDQTDQGQDIIGRNVRHGGHGYQILGSPNNPGITIRSGFDAAEMLAVNLASDGGQSVQPTDAALNSAKSDLRNHVDADDLGKTRAELINRISSDDLVVQLNSEDEFVSGFEISSQLFPYSQEITISEFYEKVQSLINASWRGKSFLVNEYGLREVVQEGLEQPRGFQ